MRNSVTSGQKLAVATLAVEILLALFLASNSLGLFAILAMTVVGIAWIPAAILIFSDLRQDNEAGPSMYIVAGLCGIAGVVCLFALGKWTALAFITS